MVWLVGIGSICEKRRALSRCTSRCEDNDGDWLGMPCKMPSSLTMELLNAAGRLAAGTGAEVSNEGCESLMATGGGIAKGRVCTPGHSTSVSESGPDCPSACSRSLGREEAHGGGVKRSRMLVMRPSTVGATCGTSKVIGWWVDWRDWRLGTISRWSPPASVWASDPTHEEASDRGPKATAPATLGELMPP